MADQRLGLLTRWTQNLLGALQAGALGKVTVRAVETVCGPRAGALEVDAGLSTGDLLRTLTANDAALHRQFVPWAFVGEPAVYLTGRFLRLEAGWPDGLAEKNIRLSDLGRHPAGGGRWIAGKNEAGATVTLGLDDAKPHYLIGGWTGSGKTWALRSALVQLARDRSNRLVLVDAKWGASLGCLAGLPGLAGPLATDLPTAKQALSWAVREMRRRYETGDRAGRVIVAVDEVQELQGDAAAVELLRRLVVQGRGAGVHVILGTQHPTREAFGDQAIKRNLPGRLALRVEDAVASNVVVGAPAPRADHLLGAGDAYAVIPGAVQRLQLAYIPERELPAGGGPELTDWPDYDPEAAGTLPENRGGPAFVPAETGAALLAAHLGKGRPWLRDYLQAETGAMPGGDKARRLLADGRALYEWLTGAGWTLTATADELTG